MAKVDITYYEKGTRLRLGHRSPNQGRQKTTVRDSASLPRRDADISLQPTGFIYRHLAAGPPTEGLYAHYDITEELGKGSFATVMKALCRENGTWYAVKMIAMNQVKAAAQMTTATDRSGEKVRPDPTTTLQKEVKILERLKHPNICQLKEVFYEDDYISEFGLVSVLCVSS